MKKFAFLLIGLSMLSYGQEKDTKHSKACLKSDTPLSNEFKEYWYKGKAEITSYTLEQARYGEIHKGKAVTVFVTEPFSPITHTKADKPLPSNISVLKLNTTKKFNTGIYPYSLMTSSFHPVEETKTIKVSSSVQEWCGHEYVEMKRKNKFSINNYSYFQGESYNNKTFSLNTVFENDIWTQIRINPNDLPKGTLKVFPDFTYMRLLHKPAKTYTAYATVTSGKNTSSYKIYYPELERTLELSYQTYFPHKIISWTETYSSGFGAKKKTLTTRATALNSIMIDYWNTNNVKDTHYREELGL